MTKHGNKPRESSVKDNDRHGNKPPVEDNNRHRNKRRETQGNNRKRKELSIEEGNNHRSHTPTSPWYPSRNHFTLNLRTLRDPTPISKRNVSLIRSHQRIKLTYIRNYQYDKEASLSSIRRGDKTSSSSNRPRTESRHDDKAYLDSM